MRIEISRKIERRNKERERARESEKERKIDEERFNLSQFFTSEISKLFYLMFEK